MQLIFMAILIFDWDIARPPITRVDVITAFTTANNDNLHLFNACYEERSSGWFSTWVHWEIGSGSWT